LAEDNKFNQQFAEALLRKAGYEVEIVQNGHEAVSAIQNSDYDVVLMDVQMPELDGMQATRQIRALSPPKCNTPIIALTANAMTGAKEEYLSAGMNDYVSKPIRRELLLSKLANLAAEQKPLQDDGETGPASDGPLDQERLATLASVLPVDGVRRFIEEYLVSVDGYLADIRRHMAGDDLVALSAAAHNLISVAGNVGAIKVSAAASALERASRSGNHKEAPRLVGEIGAASEAASAALRVWLSRNLSAA
jgi:CheY-like chemotaxis protein/HPt (histidine-containing phosphotransfer) domain-containing protein